MSTCRALAQYFALMWLIPTVTYQFALCPKFGISQRAKVDPRSSKKLLGDPATQMD